MAAMKRSPRLRGLQLPNLSSWWTRAGFAAGEHSVGGVLFGEAESHSGWTWQGGPGARGADYTEGPGFWRAREGGLLRGQVDRIPVNILEEEAAADSGVSPHPSGATGLYSVVLLSPDLHRTVGALEEAGLPLRNLAEPSPISKAVSMAFFKMRCGVIVEVLAPTEPGGPPVNLPSFPPTPEDRDAPARIVGMVVTVPELEPLAEALPPGSLAPARPAVQRGRRIAPLRDEVAGVPLSVAFMTPRPSD